METVITSQPLFKRDSTGKIREWFYEVGKDSTSVAWRTVAGTQDGKKVTSEWRTVEQKNVGKANETSLDEQALLEAEADEKKKLDRGYFRDISDVDTFTKIKPMLASKHEDAKYDFTEKEYYSQPKLDGIRCIARANGLWSRAGKEIIAVPHIMEALKPFFDANPDAILDGELYNHDLKDDFNKITSLVRKAKPKPSDIEEAKDLVQYHIYDVISSDKDFYDRWLSIKPKINFGKELVHVETTRITTQPYMDGLYAEYIGDGYEGQMIRVNGPYQENKRSKLLMKRKDFITEEYRVLGVYEGQGNWSGCIKRFELIDDKGNEFGAGVRGTQDKLSELFESGKQPDWATLRYFELTPDGIPRFPVVIDYGYGQRED